MPRWLDLARTPAARRLRRLAGRIIGSIPRPALRAPRSSILTDRFTPPNTLAPAHSPTHAPTGAMKRFIFHVGYHKTGTTFLQESAIAWFNRHARVDPEAFSYRDLAYLRTAVPDGWGRIKPRVKDYVRGDDGALDEVRRGLGDLVASRPESTVFLSDENWGMRLPGCNAVPFYPGTARVAALLASLGEEFDVTMVAAVRRQDTLLESWFAHNTREGQTRQDFMGFLHGVDLEGLDWCAPLAPALDLLGPDRLHVVPFELLRLDPEAMLDHFRLEYWNGAPVSPGRRTRPSLSHRALVIMRAARDVLPKHERERLADFLERELASAAPDEPTRLPRALGDMIARSYLERNRRLFDEFVHPRYRHLFGTLYDPDAEPAGTAEPATPAVARA